MKIYIRAAVSIDNLKAQYGQNMPGQKFTRLIELDPTADYRAGKSGKYCRWIFEMDKKGLLDENDYMNVFDALKLFAKQSKKYPKQDLLQYKTVDEFLQDTRRVGNMPLTEKEKAKLLKKQAHNASDSDKKLLVTDGTWQMWQALTHPGDISLARMGCTGEDDKASWCTAYEGEAGLDYFNSYSRKGPLYVFIDTTDPVHKYQSNLCENPNHNSWFFDWEDNEQGKDAFFEFCFEHPNIAEYLGVSREGGVITLQGKVVDYDNTVDTITVPDGMTSLPMLSVPKSCKQFSIPDSITEIPPDAFKGSNVETVIANNITKIGKDAFRESKITNIDLSNATKFGSSSFRYCNMISESSLMSIPFDTQEVMVGAFAFADNDFETTITITPLTTLSMGSFAECPNLTIVWDADDAPYKFKDIYKLVVDESSCPKLCEVNADRVTIEPM